MNTERSFFHKKAFIGFCLSVFVFSIHSVAFLQYEPYTGIATNVLTFIRLLLTRIIPQVAVPLFMILAGYSFFRGYTLDKTKGKLKRRVKTLIIPYLFWNTIWLLFDAIASKYFSQFFLYREITTLDFETIILGVFCHGSYSIFWFVADLIIFSFLSPILYVVLKSKYKYIFIIIVFTLYACNIRLPQPIFVRQDAILYYIVGAISAMEFKTQIEVSSKKKSLIGTFITILCWLILGLHEYNLLQLPEIINVMILIIISFAFWFGTDIIHYKTHWWYSTSFLIYAMAYNIGAVLIKVMYFILPKYQWMSIVNYFVSMIVAFLVVIGFAYICGKFFPKILGYIGGGRIVVPLQSDNKAEEL